MVIDITTDTIEKIDIGRQYENHVVDVTFDYTDWAEEFGEGTLRLLVMRRGDEVPYSPELEVDGTTATWHVSSLDTEIRGVGKIECTYVVDDQVKKSAVARTSVKAGIYGNGEPRDPFEAFLDALEELAETTQEYGEAAVEAKDTAVASAQSASADAQSTAEDVETVRGLVQGSQSHLGVLESRMDTFASLPAGSTSGNAELADIRVADGGTTYPTAGDAVRGQFSNLKSDLNTIKKSVFDATTDMSVVGKIIRSSDGQWVGNANYVISGWFKVNAGDIIKYKSDVAVSGAIIGLYSGTNPVTDFEGALAEGTGSISEGTVTVTQSGYVAFCCNKASVGSAYLYFNNNLALQIHDLTKDVSDIEDKVEANSEAIEHHSKELMFFGDDILSTDGLLIRKSDGQFVANANYAISDFIEVKSGDVLNYKTDIPTSGSGLSLYSTKSASSFISNLVTVESSAVVSGSVTIEQNGYVVFCCNKGSTANSYLYFSDSISGSVQKLNTEINNMQTAIGGKVNKPASDGTNGQILKTNGDGTTEWIDSADVTDIEEAVDEWLNAHPEKTTTVEDRSITSEKIASGSFIAGGTGNVIRDVAVRDSDSKDSHAEGYKNIAQEWYDHAEGCGCIVDGKISHVEGNACICTANDAHAEGNRTVAGRRYYHKSDGSYLTKGSEDAGDSLGVLNYVIVPDSYGDVTTFFPNAFIDNVETRYGTGAQIDVKGNVYAGAPYNFVPAVWNGDTVVTPNDLRWAMHSICILRGTAENHIVFVNIAKAVYTSGSGTKIYYYGNSPYANYLGIYSSYAPRLLKAGNGTHAEGFFTSAWGTGSHSEGQSTDAWGDASHTEGIGSVAIGDASHAQGLYTKADGIGSDASGKESKASRPFQKAHSSGMIASVGDNQACEIIITKRCPNAGWHNVPLITNVENGKSYLLETMVVGKQSAGSAGSIGDTFGYKFTALINVKSDGTYEAIGTPERTLISRSSGMDGDGLSSGVRLSWYNGIYPDDRSLCLRMDSIANATFYVTCHTKWVELAV